MSRLSLLAISLLCISYSILAFSNNEKKTRPPIDPNRIVDIKYGNSNWNTDSSKVDVATLILKDASSKKIVLINLFETGPDESVFRGRFSVSWGSANNLIPEVYIPVQEELKNRKSKALLLEKIKKQEIKRKPFILTRGERGQQVIDVFDTPDQARLAYKNYRQQIRLKKQAEVPEEVISRISLEMAEKMRKEKEEKMRKQKALTAEAERIRLKQLEDQKREENLAAQKKLAAAEKAKRKKQASRLAEEGVQLYLNNNFVDAQKKFEEAVDLDPENKSYYYSYAITLYRNGKDYNKAIVIFQAVEDPRVIQIEKDFYLGMSHFRINDYQNAGEYFRKLKNKKQEPYSSSSAFYEGLSFYAEKKWEPAKQSFQWVLDNSKDPKLDEKAEEYIEKITKIQYYENNKTKQHILSAGGGVQYDSNVLLNSEDPSSATPSGAGDFRGTALASYEYRPIYTDSKEWSLKTSFVTIYSMDSANAAADPTVLSISSPYVMKGKWKEKSYKSEIKAFFDAIYMDSNSSGTRDGILDTYGVYWRNTLIHRPDFFSSYNLKLGQNVSYNTTDEANSDGLQTDFEYNNTWFLNKKKNKALIQESKITYYNAAGVDERYYRLNLSLSYLKPVEWQNLTTISKLAIYYSDYPDHSTGRSDTNFSLSYTASKKLTDTWNLVGIGSYTSNQSTEDSRAYSKFILSSLVTGTWKF
ncbi:MAG: hypothetical protein CL674_13320 [Bdellovibrionaceae bacterium]|nr:hypothetical protein [Pseudobdellovibrionaceae bacterium]|tara:strand:+ start:14476 stop:16569 length:2094 start_codon:yes stop_codon:yes gene_type:complete